MQLTLHRLAGARVAVGAKQVQLALLWPLQARPPRLGTGRIALGHIGALNRYRAAAAASSVGGRGAVAAAAALGAGADVSTARLLRFCCDEQPAAALLEHPGSPLGAVGAHTSGPRATPARPGQPGGLHGGTDCELCCHSY